jgi:hypothetical protein
MALAKPILVATIAAGTLDLLSAFVFAGLAGMGPAAVLQFVASGPFGDVALAQSAFIVAGAVVHYAIMACMVGAYVAIAPRALPALFARPLIAGILYGLLLWIIMYWLVRPLRWPAMPLPHTIEGIAQQLFSHIACVGIPIAFIAVRMLPRRA